MRRNMGHILRGGLIALLALVPACQSSTPPKDPPAPLRPNPPVATPRPNPTPPAPAPDPVTKPAVADVGPATAPSVTPQTVPSVAVASTVPATVPAVAVTQPATKPVEVAVPPPAPKDDPAEVRAERSKYADAWAELELLRREVKELSFEAAERRELGGLFTSAGDAWKALQKPLDDGRLPSADQKSGEGRDLLDAQAKVETLIGPARMQQLGELRSGARLGGHRWLAGLRQAIATQALTSEQEGQVQTLLTELTAGIDRLPAEEPNDPSSEQAIRRKVGELIETARAQLVKILAPLQMAAVVERVPELVKQAPATQALP